MSNTGTFIVIEGSDGSGKSTQLSLLAARLKSAGHDVEILHFPRYNEPSGYFVSQYLQGKYGPATRINPYTASLFYTLDRFAASQQILSAINRGAIVIADRFTGSNLAHQGSKIDNVDERRGYFLWMDSIEFQTFAIPRPSRSFILHVPFETSQVLLQQRQQEKDHHEQDTDHLRKTTEVFNQLCELFPNDFTRIDCVRSGRLLEEQTIHELLWSAVQPLLPNVPQDVAGTIIDHGTENRPTKGQEHIRISRLLARSANIPILSATSDMYVPSNVPSHIRKEYASGISRITARRETLQAALVAQGISDHDNQQYMKLTEPYATLVTANSADVTQAQTALLEGGEVGMRPAPGNSLLAMPVAQPASSRKQQSILVARTPRSEYDVLARAIYEQTTEPLTAVEEYVDSLSFAKKHELLVGLLSNPDSTLFTNCTYEWDCILTETEAEEIVSHGLRVTKQPLTTAHGYDMPQSLPDDCRQIFDECITESQRLYDALTRAGYGELAQYTVLSAHRQRYLVNAAAQQLAHAGHTKPVLREMYDAAMQAHPTVFEHLALHALI